MVEQAESYTEVPEPASIISQVINEIFLNPLNLILLTICGFLIYKIFFAKERTPSPTPKSKEVELPPLKKRDMTLEELKNYNGMDSDGRICVAVNGKIFDVTKGKRFYGPGGPYYAFAGRDASRGLATFSVEAANDEYDDLSDLNTMQMESVREWEMQFKEKYHYVGRLLRSGEEPTDYSDDEETSQDQSLKDGEKSDKEHPEEKNKEE
ncbi:membrane-associated progesterone receptor component 1-like [Limulus polyphemus]|uniref:Membrane-associated progesterone receptor component 1-like n=1 Tax=Limulus polyphemus TaxID=6850 RepID=A0ABM1BC76_LIMPO|nr:membrane-associated progesterone receptor component 1-like [Limulus polyphemus]